MDQLVQNFYGELKRLARSQRRGDAAGLRMDTTSLVHECYLRLRQSRSLSPENRAHFFGAAALAMRHILVDHARSRFSQKRGQGFQANIQPLPEFREENAALVVAVDDALKDLTSADPIQAKLIEMRFFGGLTAEESAEALRMSVHAVRRDLRLAHAWLRREIRSPRPVW